LGNVHPDQFTQHITFGNVRERKFGDIWTDMSHPVLAGLKNRKPLLKGRCAGCAYLDLCNGNFRTRAQAITGDLWESDPACYLTDEEIQVKQENKD
jgi:radical SAM protein with 4Fe4S-binding SPASM domain